MTTVCHNRVGLVELLDFLLAKSSRVWRSVNGRSTNVAASCFKQLSALCRMTSRSRCDHSSRIRHSASGAHLNEKVQWKAAVETFPDGTGPFKGGGSSSQGRVQLIGGSQWRATGLNCSRVSVLLVRFDCGVCDFWNELSRRRVHSKRVNSGRTCVNCVAGLLDRNVEASVPFGVWQLSTLRLARTPNVKFRARSAVQLCVWLAPTRRF